MTFAAGQRITAAQLNLLSDPPMAVLYQTTAQSINNTTSTTIQFDTTVVDTRNGHSNSTNNTRYTAQVAGSYWVVGTSTWAASPTNNRSVNILKNGVGIPYFGLGNPAAGVGINPQQAVSGLVQLNVGDYVEISVYQDSGGALSLKSGASSMVVIRQSD